MILVALSCVAGLALDGMAVRQMLMSGFNTAGLLLHVAATLVALPGMIGVLPAAMRSARLPSFSLCLGVAATAPVVGILAILYLGLQSRKSIRSNDEDLPYITGTELEDMIQDSGLAGDSIKKSVVDLLHGPDTVARRNAILALKEVEPRLSIPLLRKGVQDSDEQVRIYAQNNLARIITGQEQSIKRAEANLTRAPEDAAAMVRLADEYHELVYLGLVDDDEGCISYLDKAIALLDSALQMDPENQQALFLLMKCCIRRSNLPKAEICATKLKEVGMQNEILIPWVLEIQFAGRRWDELKSTFAAFRDARYSNPKIESLTEFWIGNPSALT